MARASGTFGSAVTGFASKLCNGIKSLMKRITSIKKTKNKLVLWHMPEFAGSLKRGGG